MNRVGVCIIGGGMPKINLFKEDEKLKNKFSHENEDIKRTYEEFYGKLLSKSCMFCCTQLIQIEKVKLLI